jgi:ketosteroid isomerase-like protein
VSRGLSASPERDTARAMSQENVEIVRATFDALNSGDVDAVIKGTAPDFEFDFSRAVGPAHGVFGRDQLPDLLREFDEPWESVRREVDDFIEAGEQVVTPITSHHRGRDGIELQARIAMVWTIRDGTITHAAFYQERQEAFEAAGLSE